MIVCFIAAMVFAVAMFVIGYGQVDYLHGQVIRPGLVDFEIIGVIILLLSPIFLGGKK